MRRAKIAIIGAGMAGASLAAEVAADRSVLILEAEDQPGYHSTGRSAAFWSESYGGPLVQPLTTASGPFLANPPAEFHDRSFLSERGALTIADAGGLPALDSMAADFAHSRVEIVRLGRQDLEQRIPGLLPGWNEGLFEPSCSDIDVAGLHAAYLKAARRLGAELIVNAAVTRIRDDGRVWLLETRQGPVEAETIVNAAGAWADSVAELAGVKTIGIQPYRRTIAQLRVAPPAPTTLPLVIDVGGKFYFKPEAGGRLWLSPHDETACESGDCAADEQDVALAIDRFERVVPWAVERVEHRWAGLRSFAPDRLPVFGFASENDRFFWCAGQGGFGIQTAPAAAKLCAALLLDRPPDASVAAIDVRPYSASRFAD
jgi:D-arginine dehydrogenase